MAETLVTCKSRAKKSQVPQRDSITPFTADGQPCNFKNAEMSGRVAPTVIYAYHAPFLSGRGPYDKCFILNHRTNNSFLWQPYIP